MLAIVWAAKRFRQYLLGTKFKILTDHQALKWLFNCKDPSSCLLRWRLRLEEYNYEIDYCKGKENMAAGARSRIYPIDNLKFFDVLKINTTELRSDSEENNNNVLNNETSNLTLERARYLKKEFEDWSELNYKDKILKQNVTKQHDWIRIVREPKNKRVETDVVLSNELNSLLWITTLYTFISNVTQRVIPLSLNHKSLNGLAKWTIKRILNFLLTKFSNKQIYYTEDIAKELNNEDKTQLIREMHGSSATGYLGENKTIAGSIK